MPVIRNDRRAVSSTQQLVKAIINVQETATHVQPAERALTADFVNDATIPKLDTANVFTFGQTVTITDAGTTNQAIAIVLNHATTGTPAVGFGVTQLHQAHSTTNTMRPLYALLATWATATDASRKGRVQILAYDTAAREGLRIEGSGTAAMLGFYGGAAVVKPTVTGSRGGNAALQSLLTALANLGLITDSSSV